MFLSRGQRAGVIIGGTAEGRDNGGCAAAVYHMMANGTQQMVNAPGRVNSSRKEE